MMQVFHPLSEFFNRTASEPLVTLAFGLTLVVSAALLRHLGSMSHRNNKEELSIPNDLEVREARLGSLNEFEMKISQTAFMSSSSHIQSELRQ